MAITWDPTEGISALLLNAAVVNADISSLLTLSGPTQYTGGSPTDIGGAAYKYVKRDSLTSLVVFCFLSGWAQGTLGTPAPGFLQVELSLAFADTATSHTAGFYNFNNPTDHRSMVACKAISGLDAGQVQIQARVRRTSVGAGGTAGFTADSGDRALFMVLEVA